MRVPYWYPPTVARGLKELVSTVGRMATALIALHAGRYVPPRRDSVALYRACIGDEWSDYVAAISERGKGRWGYLVPEDAGERRILHDLCQMTLAFENHFLDAVRDYLLVESRGTDAAGRAFAARSFGTILYPDPAVREAVRVVATGDADPALRDAAHGVLERLATHAD